VKTASGQTPKVAPDGDVYAFVLPGYKEGAATIEVGGEFVAASTTARRRRRCSSSCPAPTSPTPASARRRHLGQPQGGPEQASSEFLTEAMKLLQDPNTTVRFDASDLMPATVGSGSFWKGMVDWIDGKDQATVLSDIQAGYNN
jgi:alpha-glucoside transport system substrate-binding protein